MISSSITIEKLWDRGGSRSRTAVSKSVPVKPIVALQDERLDDDPPHEWSGRERCEPHDAAAREVHE